MHGSLCETGGWWWWYQCDQCIADTSDTTTDTSAADIGPDDWREIVHNAPYSAVNYDTLPSKTQNVIKCKIAWSVVCELSVAKNSIIQLVHVLPLPTGSDILNITLITVISYQVVHHHLQF